jgi:hypothetical protein
MGDGRRLEFGTDRDGAVGAAERSAVRGAQWGDWGWCCLLFVALCGKRWLQQEMRLHSLSFVDDAYYYFVAARNLVAGRGSSFDGFTRTNGYHPLWLGLVALQYKVLGESLKVTRGMEYLLGLGTLVTTLAAVRLRSLLLKLVFTYGLFVVLELVGFNGMETTVFAFCVGVLCWVSVGFGDAGRRPVVGAVVMGVAATAAIAARIDAAVFVVPWLLVSVKGMWRKGVALGVVGAAGAVYAGANLYWFGVMAPISGEVKSLGGLQWNRRVVGELLSPGTTSALFYAAAALWLLTPLAMRLTGTSDARARAMRAVQWGYLIGLPIYLLRLLCFSSWLVWGWYGYCLLLGYVACGSTLLTWMEERLGRVFGYRAMLAVVGSAIVLKVGWGYVRVWSGPEPEPAAAYYAVNHEALERYGGVLNGARVAMGDRAGEFAWEYGGGVNQMEGIMNDKAYFETLRAGGDVKALLCARDVKYVVAYEKDLGAYERARVETIRSRLSQFPAPVVEVRREDEVGRVVDLAKFAPKMGGDADVSLYLWRLPCDAVAHPPR